MSKTKFSLQLDKMTGQNINYYQDYQFEAA